MEKKDLAIALAETRHMITVLREQESELQEQLAKELVDEKSITVDGVGQFERKWQAGRRSNWDHAAIKSKLLASRDKEPRLLDPQTGAIEDDGELVFRMVNKVARLEYKTTGLKAYDIDPEEYSEASEGRHTIAWTPAPSFIKSRKIGE